MSALDIFLRLIAKLFVFTLLVFPSMQATALTLKGVVSSHCKPSFSGHID
jgi:hypothetical protein